MKKFFLLSALVLGAMTISAQLTLQCTINEGVDISTPIGYGNDDHYDPLPIQYLYNQTCISNEQSKSYTISLFDINDGILFKTIALGKYGYVLYASKNFWTTDGKVAFLAIAEKTDSSEVVLMDEDGKILQNLSTKCIRTPIIFNTNNGYKLTFMEEDNTGHDIITHIYSIPGNGQPTDLESPTAPARTSNARKVVENGQMYIILDGVKYAVTGTEM